MDSIHHNFQAAEVVFTGFPVVVESSPGAWSGTLAVYQKVRYRLIHSYKGSVGTEGDTVTVQHLLGQGAPTADEHQARLRPSLFDPKNLLLVFAKRTGDELICINPSDGVVLATDEILRGLK